jgi:hypothetical protein
LHHAVLDPDRPPVDGRASGNRKDGSEPTQATAGVPELTGHVSRFIDYR